MVNPIYYYGWEGKATMGYEWVSKNQTISWGVATSAANSLSWLKTASVTIDENVTREYFIGQTTGRDADETIKGINEVTGTLTYWLPGDIDATPANEIYMLKLPVDSLVSWASATARDFQIPSATHAMGASGNTLHPFTLEIGHNKPGTANPRYLQISGCLASSFSMRARAGERIECSLDYQAMGATFSSGTMTSPAKSTIPPLGFEHCTIKYGTSGSVSQLSGCTAFEWAIDNNLDPTYGLNAQASRVPADIIAGKRDITGTITVLMTSGNVTNNLYQDVLSGATQISNFVANKAIQQIVTDIAGTGSFGLTFYNVILGELAIDIDPTKVQELSVPFGAEEVVLNIYPAASATLPTNYAAV